MAVLRRAATHRRHRRTAVGAGPAAGHEDGRGAKTARSAGRGGAGRGRAGGAWEAGGMLQWALDLLLDMRTDGAPRQHGQWGAAGRGGAGRAGCGGREACCSGRWTCC